MSAQSVISGLRQAARIGNHTVSPELYAINVHDDLLLLSRPAPARAGAVLMIVAVGPVQGLPHAWFLSPAAFPTAKTCMAIHQWYRQCENTLASCERADCGSTAGVLGGPATGS